MISVGNAVLLSEIKKSLFQLRRGKTRYPTPDYQTLFKDQNILWMERSERGGMKRIILKGCCEN
jgi:hypothetical protein